jgi:quercetin dioxygenase-like cupin family protein
MQRHRRLFYFGPRAGTLNALQQEPTMNVIPQPQPQPAPIPGVSHATWAGRDDGLEQISLWRQTLAPGAATPPHRHDCDEVVLCLAGAGEVDVDGTTQRFGAGMTIVLPRGGEHQIRNAGDVDLQILGVFGATPVATYLPDGTALELPWRS